MQLTTEEIESYKKTFLPYATSATSRVISAGSRFAYYSSAATILKIIQNQEIWMRNAMIMNDHSEIRHGLDCLVKSYNSDSGEVLKEALNLYYPGITKEIEEVFNSWIPKIQNETYVLCLSEHSMEDDQYGRLSMWRAYGGEAGVALIINGGVLFRPSNALASYSSPVGYFNDEQLREELELVASRIAGNPKLIGEIGRDGVKNAIFQMFRFAAVCTKHPAFKEEREWRIISSPAFESSDLMPFHTEIIGEISQKILKIELKDHPQRGLIGLDPSALIDRILIGPTDYPEVIAQALSHALEKIGVKHARSKITFTNIPLRSNQR
ncbi:MAG: DUF2971 domain-containing protein [Nitrosomonas sp.]